MTDSEGKATSAFWPAGWDTGRQPASCAGAELHSAEGSQRNQTVPTSVERRLWYDLSLAEVAVNTCQWSLGFLVAMRVK